MALLRIFDNRTAASLAAADMLEASLEHRLTKADAATLIVSGGSTPVDCLRMLATRSIEWNRVNVTLSDERFLPPSHIDSNERMVRETLLTARATHAALLSLYREGVSVEAASRAIDVELRMLPFPFAGILLGMGDDGHFASLFPDADNLGQGLAVDGPALCLPVATAASPHPRISLTLAALTCSDQIVLLIYGHEKRRVFEEALEHPARYPVSRLLWQRRAPLKVLWAP
jgi:6-phosphogluconolactonase